MAAGDLTTLAYVEGYIGDSSAAVAAALPLLISGASAFVSNYCSRNFYLTDYTDQYNGSGNERLMLRQVPVVSVSSVSILGQTVPQSTTVQAYGWVADDKGLWLRGAYFPKTVKGIAVAYRAGFSADADNMPLDLQECIAIMCNIRLKLVPQEDKSSVAVMQQSTTYRTSELTPYVRQILSQYQNPFVASP